MYIFFTTYSYDYLFKNHKHILFNIDWLTDVGLHTWAKTPLNQINIIWLFEALTWPNIWNQYEGENVTKVLYDLSLHPDQYYILVSETNYPRSRCTAHAASRCWNALPLPSPARF